LDLRARCAARLRARAQFADVDRIVVRAQARIAREASRWRLHVSLEKWLAARIDEAIDDILEECQDGEPQAASALSLFSEPLGLSAKAMARGCRRFNGLDDEVRTAFFVLVVEGCRLEEACARLELPATLVARLARKGLDAFRNRKAPLAMASHHEPQHDSDPDQNRESSSGSHLKEENS